MRTGHVTSLLIAAFALLHATPVGANDPDLRPAAKAALDAVVAVEWKGSGDSRNTDDEAPDRSTRRAGRPGDQREAVDSVRLTSGTIVGKRSIITYGQSPTDEEGQLRVVLQDGTSLEAEVAVDDWRSGLQLLRVARDLEEPLALAETDPEIGQTILAGLCDGLTERMIARGIVTATGRTSTDTHVEVIQTDLSVGPMSAGAPMVDAEGRLLGIVLARLQQPQQATATFVLPAEWVRQLLGTAVEPETKVIHRGFLGIALSGCGPDEQPTITSFLDESPAEKAGLEEGDHIVEIDGRPVRRCEDVMRLLGWFLPGQEVRISVLRQGDGEQRETVNVTLGEYPQRLAARTPQPLGSFRSPLRVQLPDERRPRTRIRLPVDQILPQLPEDAGELPPDVLRLPEAPSADLKTVIETFPRAQPLTVEVQRSNVERQLDTLQQQVQQLGEELRTLRDDLQKELRELSERLQAD